MIKDNDKNTPFFDVIEMEKCNKKWNKNKQSIRHSLGGDY